MSSLWIVGGVFWLSLLPLCVYAWYRRIASRLKLRKLPHIRKYQTALHRKHSFDGRNAQVLRRTRSYAPANGEAHNFTVTELLRSPDGAYFLVKATPEGGVHYCKGLAADAAERLLKGRASVLRRT